MSKISFKQLNEKNADIYGKGNFLIGKYNKEMLVFSLGEVENDNLRFKAIVIESGKLNHHLLNYHFDFEKSSFEEFKGTINVD